MTAHTILERDMLKTRIDERGMSVTTFLNQGRLLRHAWTAVWSEPHEAMVWLHFWQGPTTLGGLAEAHEAVVSQVQAGTLPAAHTDTADETAQDRRESHART